MFMIVQTLNKYLSELIQLRFGIRSCGKFLQYFDFLPVIKFKMWKYLSGVEPPPKKSKKDYEEHRKPRSFREIWRENRAWLQYDEKEGAMFCTSCKITFKQNKFVKGCRSFRLNLKRLWIWKLKRNLNLNKI